MVTFMDQFTCSQRARAPRVNVRQMVLAIAGTERWFEAAFYREEVLATIHSQLNAYFHSWELFCEMEESKRKQLTLVSMEAGRAMWELINETGQDIEE